MFLLHKLFALIHKYGLITFFTLAFIATILSSIGFYNEADQNYNYWLVIKGILLSINDLPNDENIFLILGKLFWLLTFTSVAFSLFLKDWSSQQFFQSIKDYEHTLIIGISNLSYSYISNLSKNKVIVLNVNNEVNSNIYKDNGYAIKDVDIEDIYSSIEIKNSSRILINTNNDKINIDIAFFIIKCYKINNYSHPLRLIIRIEKKELDNLFTNSEFKNTKIEIKTYSFFEECSVKLFQDNFIDGNNNSIINTCDEYSIIIAGNEKLANKIVYEACKIAHLPNENILNIYLLSNDVKKFKNNLTNTYSYIEKIPTIKLHEVDLDYKSFEYYNNSIWDTQNLTNIIVCYDSEDINLEIASSLQNKTFLRKKDIKPNILFGMYNQKNLSQILDQNNVSFKNLKSFGDVKDILSIRNLFDDENHLIAKLINYTYKLLERNPQKRYSSRIIFDYEKNSKEIDAEWFSSGLTDKKSSLSQSKHIKIKLKTLGLSLRKSELSLIKLLNSNREIFDSKFNSKFEGNYIFPKNFDDNIFNKMIRQEHNRWNAYHYLNGWVYSKNKNKDNKEHDCLISIEEFPENFEEEKLNALIEWDIYSFVYIPNYLAEAGYEIYEQGLKDDTK